MLCPTGRQKRLNRPKPCQTSKTISKPNLRLTDQRNRFQVGTDEYNYYNDQIFELGKEYKADVANYKKSGTFNKDASLLGFDSSDPTFTGLSDDAQGQMMKNSRAIMDLQRQKDKIEKGESQSADFFSKRRVALQNEEKDAQEGLRKQRKALAMNEDPALKPFDTQSKTTRTALKNALNKTASKSGAFVTQDDPMYKEGIEKLDQKFADTFINREKEITDEGNRLGNKFLRDRKRIAKTEEQAKLNALGEKKVLTGKLIS